MAERHNPSSSEMRLLNERLHRVGGSNHAGKALWRVCWGWERLAWQGGKWEADGGGVVEHRLEPKYLPPNRFYLEKWMPPEHYGSPEQWATRYTEWIDGVRVETLGPYPSEGEYEQAWRIEGPHGGFLPLHPYVCEKLVHLMLRMQTMPASARRQQAAEEYERKRRAIQQRQHDMIDNRMRPFFDGSPGKNFVGYEPTLNPKEQTCVTP